MAKSLLWALAGLCNFVSAALIYYDGGRPLVVGMQVFAGVLMIIAAFSFRPR